MSAEETASISAHADPLLSGNALSQVSLLPVFRASFLVVVRGSPFLLVIEVLQDLLSGADVRRSPAFASTLGLAARALQYSPTWPGYPNILTENEIGSGLPAPAVRCQLDAHLL